MERNYKIMLITFIVLILTLMLTILWAVGKLIRNQYDKPKIENTFDYIHSNNKMA